jgi:hypothetical protein
MIKITCTSCQKPLSIDETKLPQREVAFPCPNCKTKLTYDNSPAPIAAVPPAIPSDVRAGDGPEPNEHGAKAMIVGADHPALRQAARAINLYAVHFATAAEAREYYLQEYPPAVFLFPQPITPPPLEAMQPLLAVTPADRRRGFFILFADNLRTLDGNAAFLYGVNLVVATKDMGSFGQVYRDASLYHERLYAPMHAVEKLLHLA